MIAQEGIIEPTSVGRWAEALEELHGRIAHRFVRSETRERVQRFLLGLLGRTERKSGWQIAEAMGGRAVNHSAEGQPILSAAITFL
jgi:hypothetical protein